MDADYLKRTVGDILVEGIAAVVEAQPSDPVDYLGKWLLHQLELQEVKKQRELQAAKLKEEADKILSNEQKHIEAAAQSITKEYKKFAKRKKEKEEKLRKEMEEKKRKEEEERKKKEEEAKQKEQDENKEEQEEEEAE
jgi:hypothetical protein